MTMSLDYKTEAAYIHGLNTRYANLLASGGGLSEKQRREAISSLAAELLPEPLKMYGHNVTEEKVWAFTSKWRPTQGLSSLELAAMRLALVIFQPEEVAMIAGNSGNAVLAGLAATYISEYCVPTIEQQATFLAALRFSRMYRLGDSEKQA